MTKPIQRLWIFSSDSNPDKEYQTLQYIDGSTSCNCLGWVRRVASNGSRSCKHTRWVDVGTADRNSTGKHDYAVQQPIKYAKNTKQTKLGQRKFAV